MKKRSLISSYIELTKPRILTLVLITTTLGFYLGGHGIHGFSRLLFLWFGVSCVCGGSGVLNHYLERELDSKMLRTKNRPIPLGIISAPDALQFGTILILIGVGILYVKVNALTSFLSLLTTFLYLIVYTPMKRISWWNTTLGAIPGALPPLGGWSAATGTLNFDAGMLFLILFVWQHPHFYAIAWMFKDDYKRAGFKMLPVIDPGGRRMFHQILIYSLILIPVSLIPSLIGMSGKIYFMGALIAGVSLLKMSYEFICSQSIIDARKLLQATVIYLPVLLILIILDGKF